MGFFDKIKEQSAQQEKERAEKQRAKDDARLRQHGLLLEEGDDASFRAMNAESLRRIAGERGWSNYWSIAAAWSEAADKMQINLLKMLTEQHFILIRQNEQIIRLLSDRQARNEP